MQLLAWLISSLRLALLYPLLTLPFSSLQQASAYPFVIYSSASVILIMQTSQVFRAVALRFLPQKLTRQNLTRGIIKLSRSAWRPLLKVPSQIHFDGHHIGLSFESSFRAYSSNCHKVVASNFPECEGMSSTENDVMSKTQDSLIHKDIIGKKAKVTFVLGGKLFL